MRSLFSDVHMDVICVSESWFKSHHSNKLVSLPGYRLLRADRSDGRRGGGAAIYVRSELKYKVLARSPDDAIVNYIFIELRFQGQNILVSVIYNPPRIPGLPVFWPVLEDLISKYPHNLLLGDFNINMLEDTQETTEFLSRLGGVSLCVASKEATHFQAAIPTLIDLCITNDDLNGVVVSNADCYSKGPGFESRVSHGPFQKVKHWIDNPSCKK
jgi:hypothetical protein